MQITFRTDASIEIGTGHVMRCLTLAGAFKEQGARCHFICRKHPGNLIELIKNKGHAVTALTVGNNLEVENGQPLVHAEWLGVSQAEDAKQTLEVMLRDSNENGYSQPNWLVVDHYALDMRWEQELKPYIGNLMVIDDLADRSHLCDLLLDQTFGRLEADYSPLVPVGCKVLCGAQYALLRPEFSCYRSYSLERRRKPQLKNIMISMGGVDKDNVTGQVLEVLQYVRLPEDCQITVIMGSTAPWLELIRQKAETMRCSTTVLSGVTDMARLMAECDLAIGAAGATSWERCCLGLPTIMLVLAENQYQVAHGLGRAGAAKVISNLEKLKVTLPKILDKINMELDALSLMTKASEKICDGLGLELVVELLNKQGGYLDA